MSKENLDSREVHLTNVEEHIITGAELYPDTISDLEQNPEAFSGLVNVLGYTVWCHQKCVPVKRDIAPGISDRFGRIIDTVIENIPDGTLERSLLREKKRFVNTA